MGLYRNVERILADLEAAGHHPETTLTVDDLTPYDQYHYEGTAAVDDAMAAVGAGSGSNILDVGSGLGGPARYIADRSGAHVTALELQADLNDTAASLTQRTELTGLVRHVNGDVLAGDAGFDTFTGLVSMLCFLHIPERERLFARCAEALLPGGVMFVDDYVARAPLSDADRERLAQTVYCSYLPDLATYRRHLEDAGFVDIEIDDKTDDWTSFVVARLEQFRGSREELVARYDEDTVEGLDHFYATVAELFEGGNLGGTRMIATFAG